MSRPNDNLFQRQSSSNIKTEEYLALASSTRQECFSATCGIILKGKAIKLLPTCFPSHVSTPGQQKQQ